MYSTLMLCLFWQVLFACMIVILFLYGDYGLRLMLLSIIAMADVIARWQMVSH